MMAVSKALDEVKFRIPKPILETVFLKRNARWRQVPVSIDEQILACIIRPRVLVDCNLVGGTQALIPLAKCSVEQVEDYVSVYRIPKSLTQNRSIISALNITFTDPNKAATYGTVSANQNSSMMQAGSAIMDAMASVPMVSTATVQLIGENVIMVRDVVSIPRNSYLRCVLANDENMSHIQLRSYRAFAQLVTYAVKAYIYNEYIIAMDMGELHGGQNLGRFKEIIDGYSDAEELYQTFITEKWEKIAFMNDRETYSRYLKLILGGNR